MIFWKEKMPYKNEQRKLHHIVFIYPTENSILKQASDKPELWVNVAVNKNITLAEWAQASILPWVPALHKGLRLKFLELHSLETIMI